MKKGTIPVTILLLSLCLAESAWADLTPGQLDAGFDPGGGALLKRLA